MARQTGHIKIEGTIGGICFYQLDGAYYARRKSSLSRKRVLKDPKFARSRAAAGRFGMAVKLASSVYRRLPAEEQGHGVIGRLTAVANKLLCAGLERDEALLRMERAYLRRAETPIRKVIAAVDLLNKEAVRAVSPLNYRAVDLGLYAVPQLPFSTIATEDATPWLMLQPGCYVCNAP